MLEIRTPDGKDALVAKDNFMVSGDSIQLF